MLKHWLPVIEVNMRPVSVCFYNIIMNFIARMTDSRDLDSPKIIIPQFNQLLNQCIFHGSLICLDLPKRKRRTSKGRKTASVALNEAFNNASLLI